MLVIFQEIATDVIYPNTVCRTMANNTDDGLKIHRAGSVAEYISTRNGDGAVVLCGGRNNDGEVLDDCIAYTPKTKVLSKLKVIGFWNLA